ncbi:hypothetical protein [Sphingobacterium sp. LRF_L2]|uniref:hypothetical protein n=1 Tax=Sphingobacterium sp. LRF_L2 TaxID=3369421 RepID=UPI003F614001
MKRFIAIALVGLFSFVMVGMVYAAFDTQTSIELKKSFDDVSFVGIMDGVTPSVEPQYGKMVTVLPESDIVSGYTADTAPSANDPPTIRML